jgi:hypothetical protein
VKFSTVREFFRVVLVLIALGWFFYVVFRSRFQEGFILLMGAVTISVLLIVLSRTRFRKIRVFSLVLFALLDLVTGRVGVLAADRVDKFRVTKARSILKNVADGLDRYRASAGTLPDCSWKCMAEQLEKIGLWRPEVRYSDGGKERMEVLQFVPLRDPWSCKYIYSQTGDGKYELLSSGPDRRLGTRDDIVVRSPEG